MSSSCAAFQLLQLKSIDHGECPDVLRPPSLCPQTVATTQAQFDLLHSFTEVTQSSEPAPSETRTTWAALSCGYCSKTFKTSGGLNRHVSLVRLSR